MQLKINLLFVFLFFLFSCKLENESKIAKIVTTKNNEHIVNVEKNNEHIVNVEKNDEKYEEKVENTIIEKNYPIYVVGDPYFIEGIKYTPEEDYNYIETGLATYYDKEIHNLKTINNELNKVTHLYARHKTLPVPSIAKITNLENGLSLTIRINDRSKNNSTIIEVSRKVAQLLRFYKEPKLAKVKIEILADESKQLKIVIESMDNPEFSNTIDAAPTEPVSISDLNETTNIDDKNSTTQYEQPILLEQQKISSTQIFVKVFDFSSYQDTIQIKNIVDNSYKITTQKEKNDYVVIFGPMLIHEADNLFKSLLSKGYKSSKIIVE